MLPPSRDSGVPLVHASNNRLPSALVLEKRDDQVGWSKIVEFEWARMEALDLTSLTNAGEEQRMRAEGSGNRISFCPPTRQRERQYSIKNEVLVSSTKHREKQRE
jgi:hypothetical protein